MTRPVSDDSSFIVNRQPIWLAAWLALVTATLVLGTISYWQFGGEGLADALYFSVQLFTLSCHETSFASADAKVGEATLLTARWCGLLTLGVPIIIGVVGLSRIVIVRARLARLANHVIIFGFGRLGMGFAQAFRDQGQTVLVVEKDADAPLLRSWRGLCVIGDATVEQTLRKARIHLARQVLCVTNSDFVNCEIATVARALVDSRRPAGRHALTCHVHVDDPNVGRQLTLLELRRITQRFRREFFTVCELAARELVFNNSDCRDRHSYESTLQRLLESAGTEPVGQVLLVGLGKMGQCLLLTVADHLQARRQSWGAHTARLRVTVVDEDAEEKTAGLRELYPKLDALLQIETRPLDRSRLELELARLVMDANGRRVDYAFVCEDDDEATIAAALCLIQPQLTSDEQFRVALAIDSDLQELLTAPLRDTHDPVALVLNYYRASCQPSKLPGAIETLGRAIHERYLKSQQDNGKRIFRRGRWGRCLLHAHNIAMARLPQRLSSWLPRGSALYAWDALAEIYKESSRKQADLMQYALDRLGFALSFRRESRPIKMPFQPDRIEELSMLELDRFQEERKHTGHPDVGKKWVPRPAADESQQCYLDRLMQHALFCEQVPDAAERQRLARKRWEIDQQERRLIAAGASYSEINSLYAGSTLLNWESQEKTRQGIRDWPKIVADVGLEILSKQDIRERVRRAPMRGETLDDRNGGTS